MKRATVSVFPMRSEPSHRSEMVSQVLFGEAFEIQETKDEWNRIRLGFDGYEGWVESIPSEEADQGALAVTTNPFLDHNGTILPMGSEVMDIVSTPAGIRKTAESLLNTPYLWGGRTFMGIDCSGFTQIVHKVNGIRLPRDASQQVNEGTEVRFEEARENDLAFFLSGTGKVTHVGILLEGQKIIHASRYVRIDTLTTEGIFADGKRTHTLFKIKRIS